MTYVLASSETQGRSVGPGEKARRKFSSTDGNAPGYRLSPDYFQTVKRLVAPDQHKKFFVLLCPIGEQFLLSSLALGDLQLGDLIINGQIVTINNWPMKFVEVYVLGNLRMTINKGYSGVFELNISVYQSREVCALNTSAFQRVMITYSRLEHLRIFSFSRGAHRRRCPLGMS